MKITSALPGRLESVDVLRHGVVLGQAHGEARFIGSLDEELSVEGLQQMQEAIDQCDRDWDLIVSSPLRRCSEFAEALSIRRGIPCLMLHRFREYHFGVWEGEYVKDIATRNPVALEQFWADPVGYAPVGAESMQDFYQRVSSEWDSIIHHTGSRRILVISHGGVMRALYCYLKQIALTQFMAYQPSHGEILSILNGGLAAAEAVPGLLDLQQRNRKTTCVP